MNRSVGLRRIGVAAALFLATVGVSHSTLAGDPAAAQELFDQARAADAEGDWREACRLYRASYDLDPSLGAQLNISVCFEREGKLASALAGLERARVANRGNQDREHAEKVRGFIDEETTRLGKLVGRLAIDVDHRPEGLKITRGAQPIPLSAVGTALPIDAGEVSVEATAPGWYAVAKATIKDGERQIVALTLVRVQPEASEARPAGGVADEAAVWPWITAATAVAFTGVSVGFAVDYISAVDALKQQCPGYKSSNPQCEVVSTESQDEIDELNDRKNRDAYIAAAFGGGAAVLLGASILGWTLASGADGDGAQDATHWIRRLHLQARVGGATVRMDW